MTFNRAVRYLFRRLFKPAARYPADPRAVFILALSVFGGITALALEAAPESLELLLPRWAVVVWGIALTAGSATTIIGMAFQTINGIIAEQIGSVVVGATTIFYSGVAFYVLGASALQSVGIILAWGLACFVRWIQLQVLIHSAIHRAAKIDMLHKLFDEIEGREGRDAADRARHVLRLHR